MFRCIAILLLSVACSHAAVAVSTPFTACQLRQATYHDRTTGLSFEIEGQLTYIRIISEHVPAVAALEDQSGGTIVRFPNPELLRDRRPGDIVRLTGTTGLSDQNLESALVKTLTFLRHEQPPAPIKTNVRRLAAGQSDFRLATFEGTVRDAFPSQTSIHWSLLVILDNEQTINVSLTHRGRGSEFASSLIGATVRLTGICVPVDDGLRIQGGRIFKCSSPDAVEILQPPSDLFGVPSVDELDRLQPDDVSRRDRHLVRGFVIAVWGGNRILLRKDNGGHSCIDLAAQTPPAIGEHVDVIGFPASNLYTINLTRAKWRPASPVRDRPLPVQRITASELLTDGHGHDMIKTSYHGQAVCLRGTVRNVPSPESSDATFHLADGNFLIPVDVCANRTILNELRPGCDIEVSGTIVLNVGNWRPNDVFPKIDGIILVPRTPDDIRILSYPSWWTPIRLVIALAVLGLLLVVTALWNRVLNRIITRRSRELLKEQIAHIRADFHVAERTRLAVELHDSLAQNLTGIALEIETAEQFTEGANSELTRHLTMATRSLRSCREELRNCLWDLRNQALEEKDLNKAIEQTLLPHVKGVKTEIDVSVPRDRLSDKTVHVLLSIIRELVVNGIRHGHAKAISVSGVIKDGGILVVVSDDGCGFDPDLAPGLLQGHFGLQGIRERIRPLDGKMHIESKPDHGTTVSISLKRSQKQQPQPTQP